MKNFLIYTLATITGIIISSVLLFLVFIGIVSAIIAASEKHIKVKEGSVLILRLNYPVEERSPSHPFKNFNWDEMKPEIRLGLHDIIRSIGAAATDSNIRGIYLETPVLMTGWASASEIRQALINFRASGKFVYSYADMYSQNAYYLASAANKIYLNPEGIIDYRGLNAKISFIKGTLDKLGIEMQIARGRDNRYKTAVEPITRKNMSDENRSQTTLFVNGLWQNIINDIATSRNISAEILNKAADNYRLKADSSLLKNKLIDGFKYKDEVLDELRQIIRVPENKDIPFINIADYHSTIKPEMHQRSKNKIVVIYATGDMLTGEGNDEDNMYSEEIARELRNARRDSSVKAIVLRIRSGGGSALAAEIIWREVSLTVQTKPVIASLGDVAASGGYYMCCHTTGIAAMPHTITGSIGAFGTIPNMQKLFNDKLGITFDGVKTNRRSDYFNIDKPMSAEEKILFEELVESTYETFITRVAEGRKLSRTFTDSIGKGKVWDATNARRLGLVDTLCGLDAAIDWAARKAGIKNYRIIESPKQSTFIEELLHQASETRINKELKQYLGEWYPLYKTLYTCKQTPVIQTRMPYIIQF